MSNYRRPYENELWHSGHHESRQSYSNELYHYGILGMKWGVRRYQNPDGSYTDAGKKRYSNSIRQIHATEPGSENFKERLVKNEASRNSSFLADQELAKLVQMETMYAIDSNASGYKTPEQKVEAVTKDCFPFSAGFRYTKECINYPGVKERINAAADLGIKALKKKNLISEDAVYDDGLRSWFLYEDQTFGLGLVADMINRGYSAKQVSKMIDIVDKNKGRIKSDNISDRADDVMFDITEGNWQDALKTFAKECEDIKNSKS